MKKKTLFLWVEMFQKNFHTSKFVLVLVCKLSQEGVVYTWAMLISLLIDTGGISFLLTYLFISHAFFTEAPPPLLRQTAVIVSILAL